MTAKRVIVRPYRDHDGWRIEILSGEEHVIPDSTCWLTPTPKQSPKLRHRASDTELAAAQRTLPKLGSQRRTVLEAIRRGGVVLDDDKIRVGYRQTGATDREIALMTGLAENSVRPRRLELVEAGWVRDSGRRRNGMTVWETT